MIKDILKRSTAGLLSALTLLTTVPLSGAVDGGIMPLAEEDNEASSIVINVGEVYNIADKGVQKAWFQQNGAPRNVWPMFTEASDGTEIRAYCADHSKGNPGTSGMPYTVTSRVSDMHVYGVAVRSDARMTLNQFISFAGSPITAENFTADMYFSASQAAIWCALGDAQIAANSSYGVSYGSSTSLGYRAAGKTLSASSTSEALTLFAAIKMLEYIELDDLLTDGKSEIKIKVEEIAAAEGYVLDDTVRTLRIRRGETTELVVENTPILGQIQVVKKSAQDNPVTNQPKGSLLEGAVFEITNADTGRVVDTMTSDSRGIAASNPIPLGRYYVQEIQAPRFYQLNSEKVEVKLKVEGDVVQIEMYNDPANINTSIEKTGNYTVDAGSNMRYDFTNIANNSNVPLDSFFWHDRIPTDAVRAGTLTTGTYNARVWYKITYKTNENDYRTLVDNLLSTNRYSFKIDSGSLKLASGEYVTDIRFEFGTVPAGFKMTEKATLLVYVPAYMSGGYNIINRADCGGSYQGEWDNSTSTWVTKIYRAPTYTKPTLPQTGF